MLDWQHMPHRVHHQKRGSAFVITLTLVALVGAACSSQSDPSPTATPAPGSAGLVVAQEIKPTIFVTVFATPTARATSTLAPAPTPTPNPAAVLSEATQAAFIGDYARAIALGQQALTLLGDAQSEAAIGLRSAVGRWQIDANDAPSAVTTLSSLVADLSARSTITDGQALASAQTLLGRAHALNGDALAASANYSAALATNPVISPWLNLWLGDAFFNANQPTDAIPFYQASLDGAPSASQTLTRREKLALAQQTAGNLSAALEQYELILSRAQSPTYRARILWESAQALQTAGQTNSAYGRMNDLVANYSRTPQAFSALQALINAGQPVDELQRGIIGYSNGSYEAAREAFRRAITLYPDRADEVRYWAALNYLRLGSVADALRNLDQTITANPAGSPPVAQALGEKAKIYANAGDAANAKATFQQLIHNAPASNAGASVMLDVAQTFARNNDLVAEAVLAYEAAEALQFDEARGPQALARAAALQYRLGQFTQTLTTTQTLISKYPGKPEALLGQLWLGKAQLAVGNAPDGTATLQALAENSPDSYEGARAAELASDPTRAPLSFASPVTVESGVGSGQAEAEAWLRGWLAITGTADIRSLGENITGDLRFARGNRLWQLGFKGEAREEFEALRAAFTQDALAQYQLALFFRDIGLYRSSIGAADTLMRLSPAKTPSALPTFIARLLHPTYYDDLVKQYAQEYSLDPLLIFSLIRQESLFEPFAVSSAAANGLMQVIPTTGREINGDLNWPPNYTTADLQKPYVSARFGSYYLSKQRRFFNGDLYAALAGYNGGAGNATRWKERSSGDPDLFFMSISFDETQRYIRAIGANYATYHRLYGG